MMIHFNQRDKNDIFAELILCSQHRRPCSRQVGPEIYSCMDDCEASNLDLKHKAVHNVLRGIVCS